MGGVRSLFLIPIFVLIAGHPSAFAGISKCNAGADKAEKECQKAADKAKANDLGRSADTAKGSGNDINPNCDKMGQDIAKQQGNLGQSKGQCEAADKKCDSECKEEDTDNKIEPGKSIEQEAIAARKAKCHGDITPKIAEMAAGLANLAGDASKAAACKQASDKGGQPPPMPPMTPPQDDKKDEQKKEVVKCESSEGARYSDCNSYYTAKCVANMSESNCVAFADRFCGTASGGSQADVTIDKSTSGYKTASVVVDKGGEGLSSGFCRMYSAYKFCQATGRNECPSCQGTLSHNDPDCQNNPSKCAPALSTESLLKAQNKCPTDPMFLDPAVQKKVAEANAGKSEAGTQKNQPKSGTTAGATLPGAPGGAGPGGGGGSGAGGGGGAGLAGATPESIPGGIAVPNLNGGAGGGGGGGGSGSPGSSDEDGDRKPSGMSAQSALPTGVPQGAARDVSNQFGPNIFAISTQSYRALYRDGRLTHCRNK